ncbi:hypothetical protein ALP8811_01695 [Aliiroseovarius pelagivivens]|uniref:HTH merR-type domain-containing protein n=1 Tax=Aliiroseovarius pelagivivens TaxID=1639690 RepID=A0A2R8AKX4_9RHOB|nr:MerR family transcriptional regulator [Aliiroseovarius pelagivivens]SPF76682.1 hypothetical protein ALP8811_01695 [Aliiroseovarius pelagivivens]
MDKKSPDAFRTISEVADWLGVPTHVLRFWESRFTQVKPVKRAGGRRYYRPADMELLGGIRKLLHEDGMTIRGVQKLLREQGVKHVATMSPPLESNEMRDSDGSNVVPLASARNTTDENPQESVVQATEDNSPDVAEAHDDHQDTVDETPASAPEPAPEDIADHDSPPTLTDATDEAPEDLVVPHADQSEPVLAEDAPTERDLFSAEVAQASEAVAAPQSDPDLSAPEHSHEPTELEADIAETHTPDEGETPPSEIADPAADILGEAPEAFEPETAAPADPAPVTESDPAPEAPAPIDISHIPADSADDVHAVAPSVLVSVQLRAFRAAGGNLPDDTLSSLTARLSDLATRMAPAPSDNGQAE